MRLPRLKLSVRASVTCQLCDRESPLISEALELCSDYLRSDFERARPYIEKAHFEARKPFALPATSRHVAYECLEAAKQAGLRNVRIGNLHLLQDYRAGLATFKDSESGNS